MSAFSDYLEAQILNHIFKDTAYPKPTVLAIALYVSDPTDAVGAGTEASYTGYARQTVAFADWTTPANGVISNNVQVDFPANGGASAVTISHVAIFDATGAGAGNKLFHAQLTTSKTLQPGDVISFASGALQITLA